jgi:DNA-binding MarR family transcriptional regulator
LIRRPRASGLEEDVAAMRRFSRFYTRLIGLLEEGYLHSPFSVTEVRVLYELAHRTRPVASDLVRDLGLDAGYVSRLLRRFEHLGLVRRRRLAVDARSALLVLTAKGHRAFAPLDRRAHDDIVALLEPLPAGQRRRVIAAMALIERLLSSPNQGYSSLKTGI